MMQNFEHDLVTTTFGPLDSLDVEQSRSSGVQEATPNVADLEGVATPTEGQRATRATEIAARASDLVGGDRDRQHGQKRDNFNRIAAMWNAWMSIRRDTSAPLDAHDVGMMMVGMKLARTQSGSLNLDDYIDACGYAACAGEVAQQQT